MRWLGMGMWPDFDNAAVFGRVSRFHGWLWLVLFALLPAAPLRLAAQAPSPAPVAAPAQAPAETVMFDAAVRAFNEGHFDWAEKTFGEFSGKYPQSARVAEAVLLQARAALKQQRLNVAADLLRTNLVRAVRLTEDYRYWLAEIQLLSADFPAAAESFALYTKDYTNSTRLLEAGYREALARFSLKQWDRVIQLLETPDGNFQKAAKLRAADELVSRGALLLSEALLEKQQYEPAEAVLQKLADQNLTPEYKWRREYLRCRIQVASRRFDAMLGNVTNLLALAAATGQSWALAESVAMRGSLLEQLGRWRDAAQAYEQNLADTVPLERRNQAQLKIIQLALVTNGVSAAAQKLDAFFARQPNDKASDLVLLTLGELYLRQQVLSAGAHRESQAASASSNWLALARAQFDKLLTNYPQSPLVGKAQLDKGWCLWLEDKPREAQTAFRLAAERLPPSADQAVARFKLADTMFLLKDATNALQHYRAVLKDFPNIPGVQDSLAAPALYQILRLNVELGNLTNATAVLKEILSADRDLRFGDRSLLLLGQKLITAGQPADARAILAGFNQKFGEQSPLRPQLELALARSYIQEKNWLGALDQYKNWLARFPTNELRPSAEFNYAWLHYQAGRDSNAFTLFTNFLARYPTNELAPRAQFWLGDFYYRQNDTIAAEKAYQHLFQNPNWASKPLAFQARMMAGRATFARQAYGQAADYITNLIVACPDDLAGEILPEAFFAYGDVLLMQDADPAQPFKKFEKALGAFDKIPLNYPDSPLVPAAWGKKGICLMQWASAREPQEKDPKLYDGAIEAFEKAMLFTNAEAAVRSQAEVGLGLAQERQAQLSPPPKNADLFKSARNHYLNVLSGTNLNVNKGEKPSFFWQKEAGLYAANLAESLKDWEAAASFYKRLIALFPPLGATLEKKLERAQELARPGKN